MNEQATSNLVLLERLEALVHAAIEELEGEQCYEFPELHDQVKAIFEAAKSEDGRE